jgi:formylglycine-generating enzyme required for sulfatase activity
MEPDPFIGRTIGSSCALPDRLAARLALALVMAAWLALAGCPRKAEPPPEAGTGSNTPIQIKTTVPVPPGFEGAFVIPEADVDQHGNPVDKTITFPMDSSPCWPAELWLKEPRIEFVLIPAGWFDMGSPDAEAGRETDEGPVHRVNIARPFYMGKYEVTQGQWEAVMGGNPSIFGQAGKDAPVELVSWDDCRGFVRKLNDFVRAQQAPSPRGATPELRIPTEAEWEYACRAGTTTPFHFGATITTAQVNYDGNDPYGNAPRGLYRRTTVKAGSFPANAWGLYDMHGNVWEWCEDAYAKNYSSVPVDGSAMLEGGSDRVVRGASWFYRASYCRSAFRYRCKPSRGYVDVGFRLVVSPRTQ